MKLIPYFLILTVSQFIYSPLLAKEPTEKALVGHTMEKLRVKGTTYHKVKVTKFDANGLTIFHESGAATLPADQLPLSLKRQFPQLLTPPKPTQNMASKVSAKRRASTQTSQVTKRNTRLPKRETTTSDARLTAELSPAEHEAEKKLTELLDQYSKKQGALVALKEVIRLHQSDAAKIHNGVNQQFVKYPDLQDLRNQSGNVAKLIYREYRLKGEIAILEITRAISPQEYLAIEDSLPAYAKLVNASHKLRGQAKVKSIQIQEIKAREGLKRAKSHDAAKRIEKLTHEKRVLDQRAAIARGEQQAALRKLVTKRRNWRKTLLRS